MVTPPPHGYIWGSIGTLWTDTMGWILDIVIGEYRELLLGVGILLIQICPIIGFVISVSLTSTSGRTIDTTMKDSSMDKEKSR